MRRGEPVIGARKWGTGMAHNCRQVRIQANCAAGSDPGSDGGKVMGFMTRFHAARAQRGLILGPLSNRRLLQS